MTKGRARADALACYRAALEAVDPRRLVRRDLEVWGDGLSEDLRLWAIALGKAAPAMLRGALEGLAGRLYGGLGVTVHGASDPRLPAIRWVEGGHPLPDEGSVAGGRSLARFVGELGPRDRVIGMVSGGASACLCHPVEGVTLAEIVRLTAKLLAAGADVRELNAVRMRLDGWKDGRLARHLGSALLRTLVLSDVAWDAPGLVASGPFGGDAGNLPDAREVLDRYGLAGEASDAARRALEAARSEPPPAASDPVVLADWRTLRDAAAAEAGRRGWTVEASPGPVRGEAREVGRRLASRLRELASRGATGRCLVAAGETTVVVRGPGRGGRNQELVLGAATELAGLPEVLVASLASDGRDGASPAAGGLADGSTSARAAALGVPLASALEANDSYTLLRGLGDAVETGPTGTNVLDLVLGFVGPPPAVAGS
jgi:hydroxypyruvate reductase